MNPISLAHTAEHLFMGSLKRLLPKLEVVKVEHEEKRNSLFVKGEALDWDIIYEAELMTNKIIQVGKEVKIYYFDSLKEAKDRFPTLRALEERIEGKVRVVEIQDYDYAACNKEHVKNTKECEFFLAESLTKSKDIYEIQFYAGLEAKERALIFSKMLMKSIGILGANLDTFEKACKNLRDENFALKKKLSQLSSRLLEKISFEEFRGIKIYLERFEFLENKALIKRANELMSKDKSIVLFVSVEEEPFVLLGRSKNLVFNCSETLKEALKLYEGKGGGKEEFATGTLKKEKIEEFFSYLSGRIKAKLSEQ
ncbi:MAG: DHHA1 domain-containing protein [Nitrososphaerales archaeon]